KDEVIEACFQRTFAIMREAHARAAEAGGSGWRRLAHAAAALAAGHNAKSARMLRTYALAGLPPSLRQRMVRGFLDACDGLAGFIEAGVADGSVRDMEPRPAAQMTLALIN